MCPTTIIGKTSDGLTVYVRYRWGMLSVRLDPRDPAPNYGSEGAWVLREQIDPKGLDGCMTFDELKEHTADFIVWPTELSPRTFDEDDPTIWLEGLD